MQINFVNFGKQYRDHKDEYDEAIFRCLNSGRLVLQEELERFEDNLARKLGMKYAVGVANGTDALLIALRAKGYYKEQKIGKISVPGYTFKATMEAPHHNGYSLEIKDIEDDRMAHNVNIPVHIEGMVCKSDKAIIEDGAQAIGAKGVGYSGTYTLSFYPAKILGCFGDGGAIMTNDREVYLKAKLLRHHWQTDVNEKAGYNSRLDNVQAAFLDVKLKYLDNILDNRKQIAKKYSKELRKLPIGLPIDQPGRVWQDYVIRVKNPIELKKFLALNGIQTLGYGMIPPHKAFGLDFSLPNTEKLYDEMLRLPCNETITMDEVSFIIDTIKKFYAI